jgi:hypothetical protein
MASIQAPTTAWMAYADNTRLPPTSLYVGPYRVSTPSYTEQREEEVADPQLQLALKDYPSSFLTTYFSFYRAFKEAEHYTLFVPLESPVLDELLTLSQNTKLGYSYKDRKYNKEADNRIEKLLLRHMVGIMIQPRQIEYRNTRVHTLGGEVIHINEQGEINEGVTRIEKYLTLPTCTIFFITKEVEDLR